MPRRVQDIVPHTHRSIRDISLERNTIEAPIQPPKESARSRAKADDIRPASREKPEGKLVALRRERAEEKEEEAPVETKHVDHAPKRSKKTRGSKKLLYILLGIIVVVAGVGYVASVYFSKASFTIVPKIVPVNVNSTYIAQSPTNKTPLSYELVVVKGTATATVPATDGPQLSSIAKGKMTFYNAYSAQTQRLIAGTHISDDTGRIYRLSGSIVIPGYTTSATGTVTPGSIIAAVTADQAGQSFNVSKSNAPTSFSMIAYKGTPRYETVYAKLSTDITGGYSGTKKTVSPTALASTTAELQSKITSTLLSQVQGTIPEGYIMYNKGYTATFSAPIVGGTDPKSATVTTQGTLYGILFKKSELVTRIAGDNALAQFDGFAYDTPGLEALDFSIANIKDFSPEKKNTLIVKLKGDLMLVGSIPVDALKKKLAGISLADTEAVFKAYKPVIQIEKSSGEITPPWSKVPSNPDRITIEVLTK